MSTTDPTGDRGGGGGGGGGLASITPTDDNVTPVTSSTGVAVSPASHHHQHPPPSPLSGCYLLVVLPEPHTAQHKDLILNRLAKGFLSWDKDSCHVDLEKELQALVAQAPEGEEARNGERLIQYATENLVTEVLIHPQTNTLLQCMRNLLASFTKHRHIIHAGYTFSGNGSWILQDGTFSLADFLDAFSEHEVQRVLRAYENSVTVDINCAGVGEWSTSRLSKEACTRSCRVRLNPDDVLTAGVPAITSFTSYVGQYLVSQTLDQLMEPSDVVGNIRFSHPTLYVFPGGQGDAALFGINGFNMLVDGGFARKACFWDFARHLDRLDAVLMTRINNSNVGGMSSVLRKKREMHVYPQIGHFFCNLIERKNLNSPDGDKDLDPLILNLTDIGHEMMVDLRHINLRAHPCYRDPNPINLYHKVGHGTLDMYVLSPSKDSREVREFLSKWHASDSKLFSGSYRKDSNNLTFPIQNLASICALLVWQPANPEDTITRILFPGSTPQHKIFEGIDRLKHLEFLKHPVCTAKSISPSTSLLTLKDKPATKQKLGLIEEAKKTSEAKKEKRDLIDGKVSKAGEDVVSKPTPQGTPVNQAPKVQPAKIDVKTKKVIENKKIETESKKIEKDLKEHKKEPAIRKDATKTEKDSESKKVEGYKIKMDNEKAALAKEPRPKPEPKKKETKESKPAKIGRIESTAKSAVRLGDKKQKPQVDKKEGMKASPTTPKKSMNGAATKVELSKATPRPISKPSSKTLSSTMPAKSAKDANNRKVVEQKNIEIASAENAAAPASTKAPAKPKVGERKPIGRRPKPISPIKARLPISPTKSTRSTPTTSVKSDKDGIIRKIKGDRGTADSSTVSTPSGIEIDSMTKLADKCLTEKSEDMSLDSIESKVLADLKEEREVVEEIEAVLQKAERIEGARRDDHLEGDDDITAEATDKKEDDMTEDDVTADIEEMPKKESSRKTSHELTEEDEYLIIEKEEIYIEDSVQSGEVEEKHAAGSADAQVATPRIDEVPTKEEEDEEEAEEEEEEQEEAEISEEKEKADIPEKQLGLAEEKLQETEEPEKLASSDEVLDEQMKNIIASTAEMVQKTEDKDDSGKKDSEDITKEPSSLSPDKFDSSEKKTTDTDVKPETDQKDRQVPEKLEESHERMSTLESGATTTAPTLPEDERIPLDEIKEVIDEKCLVDQETKPDGGVKVPEPLAAQIPPETKQEAKPFDVRPALHGIQREIVKTPDEVADLPVHEEVDPNLYRMEQHYEKGKEEKPSQAAPPQKEVKEPEVPVVKEQKGVFSFFGKVADKFEKGMDKLTGKSRRDSEKDIDEKSSSKSGSPKEIKAQSIVSPAEFAAEEVSPGLVKVVETSELPENFEKGTPDITQVKVAAIKDTATFLADEIEDLKKTGALPKEPIDMKDEVSAKKLESEAQQPLEPVFETCVLPHAKDKLDRITSDLEGEEDVEEVEALLAEASKKFQDVKDSLHDSLESLEEKIAEEEMVRAGLPVASQDFVKETLSEVVEKLEDIKPKDLDELSEKKGLEEPEAEVEGDEEFDDEKDEAIVTKDLKGAVRDVGGLLAGSAGILIAEKPKDVIEIVKKVAEVLKKDDFLSPDVLFDSDATEGKGAESEGEKASEMLSTEAVIIPKKAGATEELPSQEETEELRESRRESTVSLTAQKTDALGELHEETAAEASKIATPAPSPTKDTEKEKMEAMKLCAESLDDEPVSSRPKRSIIEDPAKKDVVEAGIEAICVKQTVEKPTSIEGESDQELKAQNITFDRKVSPVTAEVVIVTPDLSPTSPMLPTDKIHREDTQAKPEVSDVSQLLPSDILTALQNEGSLEKVIEELVYTKKIKITREIIQHIIIVRRISRYDVIRIIEELIIKRGSLPENVITDMNLLTEDLVSREKREEIEDYINEEYIKNNKKITMKIIEDICIQKGVTKRVLNTIIILIVIKRKMRRETLLDLSDKEYTQLDLDESAAEEQDRASETSEISGFEDGERHGITSPSAGKYAEVRNFIENELVLKGQKITPQLIDDVCVAKHIPRRVFIEIIEKILIERQIPRSSMVDISEKEMSELLASEKEDEAVSQPEEDDEDADRSGSSTPDRGQEIASYISDEFISKKKKITVESFKDICARNDVSVQMLWNLIDNVIEKQKLPRAVVIDISENELTELLAVEDEEIVKEGAGDMEPLQAESCDKNEIENNLIEEFVSTKRRITPYIFEDICLRYKASRRIIIEIIETIIVKKHLQRNSILDITDTELSELLAVVEAEDEEETEVGLKSPVKERVRHEDIEEDQLVDGFVNIPSKADVTVEDVLKKVSVELVAKESEKDVDDFEAVEQEYKIYGLSLTPDKELPLTAQSTAAGDKLEDEVEDIVHDHVSDVVEAEEKIVGSALTISVTTKLEEKSADLSDISETTDAMEKYLVEAKEKPEAVVSKAESVSPIASDIKPSELPIGKKAQEVLDEVSVQDSGVEDATHKVLESEAKLGQGDATSPKAVEVPTSPEIPDNDIKMATAARKPSTTAEPATQVESEKIESEVESKIIEAEIDVSMTKRDSHGVVESKMDSSMVVDTEDVASQPGSASPKDDKSSREISMNEDTPLSSSTVHRMVVTASSEDGGHEMEVCPTGSITFTPDDSLKSSPIKTTPDQDSLRLEKESIHSGISTPERDSISEKSAIGTKDGDKITPEDSLDKSPSGTRDSQDLEDSLDKSDLVKLKETKAVERLTEERKEAAIDQISEASKAVDKESKSLDAADKIIPTSLESVDVSAPETGMKDAIPEKVDVIETVSVTQTTGEQLESTKVSGQTPIEKADILKTPSSLASEIQSATEQEIAARLSDSSVIIDKKDAGEPIVPTKTPSPSYDEDYGSEEIHDRPKRSSVFDETVSMKHDDESEVKSPTKVSPTATIQESKDEKVQSGVPSHDISPSDADRSRATSVSSDTKHVVDDHEGQKILDLSDTVKSLELGKDEDKATTQVEDLHVTKPDDKISPTTADIKLDAEKEPLEHVTSPSIDSKKHSPVDLKEPTDTVRSPSLVGAESESAKVVTDKVEQVTAASVGKGLTDTSTKSPTDDSTSTGKIDEKEKDSESIGRSRSSSIAVETHDEKEKISQPRLSIVEGGDHDHLELIGHSKSPSVTSEIQDEIEVVEDFKPSSMVTEKPDEDGKKVSDSPQSPTIALEQQDEKETFDRSKSSSPAGEKEFTDRARSTSMTPAVQERKASVDQSRLESVAVEKEAVKGAIDGSKTVSVMDEKEDDKESIGSSKAPSVAGDKEDEKEHIDRFRSASIAAEKEDEKESFDRSRSPSVVAGKMDEKETTDRSKSPSVTSEKGDEKELVDRSRSSSVAIEKQDEKETIDRSKSPGVASEKGEEKESIDRSRSPSVVAEKLDVQDAGDRSRSPSIATGKVDEKETIDRSKSPSVASEIENEKESIDRSRSPSVATEKQDEKEAVHGTKSPSVASEKEDVKELIDRSRSPSVVADKHDVKEAIDRSKSPSVASEKGDEKESIDRSRSPSVVAEKHDVKEAIDRSKSPSVASEKGDEKESVDRAKSPSLASEKGDEKESIDRSRSPSIVADKHDVKEAIDRSKSPSVASEKGDEKESIDRSRSPSVVADKHDVKEAIDRSKSPSVASEKGDEKESIDRSRSPSVITDKLDVKDASDRSRSASVETDKIHEKETIDRSKSPSVASEKEDEKESIERSRSPSVVTGKQDEKETIDGSKSPTVPSEKESIDRSRSPSVVAEKLDVKDSMDRSKSPSVASEKGDEKESIDRSRSPSIVAEKHDVKDAIDRSKSPSVASEKGDEKESIVHSGSPSVVSGKEDEKETIDRSKSPSIASEKGDEKELIDRSRSSSVATEKREEKETTDRSKSPSVASEKGDEKELIDRSRSPSVATEKQDEKETIDRSKSPSVASEKGDDKELIDRSRSPSVVPEKQDEKETIDCSKSPSIASEKGDAKETIDRSRSPSVMAEKLDVKDASDHSRSPSVASEKGDEKETIDRSRSSSVATEKLDVKDVSDRSRSPSVAAEKPDEKETMARSKSPSVASEKEDEKETIARSKSPSVASEKEEEKETIARSKSPSVASEKGDEKETIARSKSPSVASEKGDEKETIARSKSPSVASEKGDEKEMIARSKSPSVASEKGDEKETIARSKSPSVASEKGDEKETMARSKSPSVASEKEDEKETIARSKSPSVASEKEEEKETIARSKSPSVASEKGDEKETIARSKSPSVASEKGDEKETIARSKSPSVASEKGDEKEMIARSKSPSVASEKGDEKETIARSKSPSVASEKEDEKDTIDRSRSPSVVAEKPDVKDAIDRSKSPSVASEKEHEKEATDRSKSPSIASEKDGERESIDRSRSPSAATEKQGEKEDEKGLVSRSRSTSLTPDRQEEKESVDRSKSPSVASEKDDGKEFIDRSRSASLAPEAHDTKESTDRSRSPSVATEKLDEKASIDRSKSPSVASEKESIARSRSASIASEKQDEKESPDHSISPSVAGENEDAKDSIDRSRSPSVVTEKQTEKETTDRSKSPSVASEKGDEKASIDRSRSASVATEKHDEKESVDHPKSPSVTSEKELIDRSRSPSVAGENQAETSLLEPSRSPSLVGEKPGEKESATRSRSSSVTIEKSDEKELRDESETRALSPAKQDEKETIAGFKAPGALPEKEDAKESLEHSRSSSIAGDKQSEKESVDLSISLSTAVEKTEEQSRSPSAGVEKHDGMESIHSSKSPSVTGEKQDVKELSDREVSPTASEGKPDVPETADRSKSPSVAGDKHAGDERDRSRSSSIAGEKQSVDRSRSASIVSEKPDAKESLDGSKSPSAVSEKHDETGFSDRTRSGSIVGERQEAKESIDRSRTSSIADERLDDKELIGRSRSASIAVGKLDEKETIGRSRSASIAVGQQEKELIDRSRSSSVVAEKQEEEETVDRSRSSSIIVEKPEHKETIDRSRSGSVAAEKQEEKDTIDRSRSGSVVAEKHEDTTLVDRSRSGSVVAEKHEEKDTVDRSRSGSVIAEKQEEKDTVDRSRSGSVVAEKQEEKDSVDRSRSGSIIAEKQEEVSVDRSRSSSIVAEKQTEEFERSRLPSIASEKTVEKTSADGSRSASISPQEPIEKVLADVSESSITVAATQKDESTVHSRSSSITGEKRDAEQVVDHSRSPSILSDNQDKIDLSVRAESPKTADADHEKTGSPDSSKPADIKKPTDPTESHVMPTQQPAEAIDDKLPKDSTKLEKDVADEPIDLSSTATTGAESSSHDAGKRASIVDAHIIAKRSLDASKESVPSVTAVQDCKLDGSDAVQAMQKLAETIADKSLACDMKDGGGLHDVETVEHEIAHDKSRSSSLFDAGEKTPKSRSPTASLIEDEVPEVSKPSDQATITKEDVSRKSSMAEISHDTLDQLPSDSKQFCTMELEGALPERGSVEIANDIAGRFAKDYHTTSEKMAEIVEYIMTKYIAKKERISPQIVEEIVTLYSISKHIILDLIEAIIIEKNVPRDVIVSFPKDDETKVSDIVSEDDHVDVIDIPPAKQLEIETRIHQEFVTKNKKITSLVINELAAMTFISRHIIIMIIQKMVRDQKGLTADLLESGILDESITKTVQSETTHEQSPEPESVKSHESSVHDDGHSGSHLPSGTGDDVSHSDKVSEDAPTISDSKRMEIENYVMEECVKKRIKINLLVFEQIIMRMGVPRSALLSVIEQIILSGKVPRAEMIDDAIYDEVERASDRVSESEDKGSKEYVSSRDRLMELSGKSTPDPKSSGYSTPEVRHYDDKYGKGMVSYSNDYESPFHKAFVGGMTEIRTTHITTLSGKSTPDYSVRGETPESLSESTSQTKLEEKFGLDTVTTSEKTSTSVHKTDVTSTTGTTTTTTVDLVTEPGKLSTKLAPSKEDPHGESDEDEQVVIKKVITTEIIEETRPVTEITIHKQEIVDQPPVMTTKTIESSSTDKHDDYEVQTISRTVQETGSPETIEIVTVKTIETVVMDDVSPETIMSKLGSLDGTKDLSVTEHTEGDVKTVTTTVTMTTASDREISPQKIVEKIVGQSSGSKELDKVGDESYTSTQVISKVTYSAPIDSQQTDKVTADHKEETAALTATLTSGGQTKSDLETSATDSAGHVEKSKSAGPTLSERIGLEKLEHPRSPVIKDLISDDRSFTGRMSPDVSSGRDSQQGGSSIHSATDVPGSPMFRDSGMGYGQMSGRSTPDKRGASRSSTATPEGVRSNEVIRTTITTTRTMSDEGDIITTTMEITETTNEKGETIILAEKTDVKVEDRIISEDMSKSTLSSGFEALKAPSDYTGEAADADQVSPRSDHSSVQSRAGTHIWGGSEERYTYSDDDVPGSPLSTTSQVGYSPQSTYPFEDHSSDKGSSRKSMEFSVADMSASFYGELPDLPPRVTTIKTTHLDGSDSEAPGSSAPAESDFSFKKFTVAKEFAGTARDGQSDGKKYIDEADLDFEKALTEHKETKTEKEVSSVVGTSSSSSQSQIEDKKSEPKSDSKKDPLAGWGSPLGLPSPKPPRKFNLRTVARPSDNLVEESQDSINFDPIKDWGEPLRLPSPAPVVDEGSNKGAPSTPKKERKQPKKIISENIKNRKRSESPAKNDKKSKDAKTKIQPVYIDLTYVPHHGNSYYTSVEFFKRVRARYYVFSGTEPSREVYDALLDAKKTWEDKDLEVTMIPTYDTDTLGYWVADNEEALAANHIDLSPSASRCTINLQDHETSCSAYRLEF